MKSLIALVMLLLLASCNKEIRAQTTVEGNNPETKPETEISSQTKKVLRKVGRTVMDDTCKYTDDKATCEAEKKRHKAEAAKDELDTKRRQAARAKKDKMEKEHAKNDHVDTDKTP